MKIGITGVDGVTNELQLTRIIALFFSGAELSLNDDKNCNLIINIPPTNLEGKLKDRFLARTIFLFLAKHTGYYPKWGILTGVRPLKLWKKLLKEQQVSSAKEYLVEEYLVSEEKIKLLHNIAMEQEEVLSFKKDNKNSVSIYIGIPFCPTKCSYCTFPAYDINVQKNLVPSFLNKLEWEITHLGGWLKEHDYNITTIYFGGGTPTSLTSEQIDKLLVCLYKNVMLHSEKTEITFEAGRPDTLTRAKFSVLEKWGIKRLSINPQTFKENTLEMIGRGHNVSEIIEAVNESRNYGFTTINMDIIIGLPKETIADVEHTLNMLGQLQPEAITVHPLAFKRTSYLNQTKREHIFADNDEIEKMMQIVSIWMEKNNYFPYYLYRQQNSVGNLENIGYAKKKHAGIYNILIMDEMETIIGCGCGAVSKFIHPITKENYRISSPKNPHVYIENSTIWDKKRAILTEYHQVSTLGKNNFRS